MSRIVVSIAISIAVSCQITMSWYILVSRWFCWLRNCKNFEN